MVLAASDGLKAWNFLADNLNVDLIIADLSMPVMDRRTLLSRLSGHRELSRISIILVSGVETVSTISDLLSLGAEYFIPKPIAAPT